jgi:hypothetical protein
MLLQLLRLIGKANGAATQASLARQLGVSEGLVGPMIDDLVRLGYLTEVEPGCGQGACSGCSLSGSCPARPQARLWALTAKGRSALRQAAAPSPQ